MRTTISLNAMLDMLMPLSRSNKKWIADKLYEDIAVGKTRQKPVFPKVSARFHVSQEILENAIGTLPEDVVFEQETKKMWEELAK